MNPNFISSDSTPNYPIQYESEPPLVHPYQIKNEEQVSDSLIKVLNQLDSEPIPDQTPENY